MLSIASWNINGWTDQNSILREEIIRLEDFDILCLSETHLKDGKNIDIQGFTWFGFNRTIRHVRAVRGSGGVGILIKNTVLNAFEVTYVDKSMEGIISMRLQDKVTKFNIFIMNGYLPPENSPHSCNSTDFFAYMLTQLYLNYDADFIMVCGDFNCRTGKMQDTLTDVDCIQPRDILDEQKNNFGELFMEFLNDSKLCMLNGRISKQHNNFTSISPKGKAVVDYMLTFHDCLDNCRSFKVSTMSDVIEKHQLQNLISEQCKPPDHSVLNVSVYCEHNFFRENVGSSQKGCTQTSDTDTTRTFNQKRYRFNEVPATFMSSENWKTAVNNLIDMFINLRKNQDEIDNIYHNFCEVLNNEMNMYLKYTDGSKKMRKRFKNKKPYWNNNLSTLWKEMNQLEKQFLKCKGNKREKNAKRKQFLDARKFFDKELRRCERKYNSQVVCDIDDVCTNNPTEFWNYIKCLGPRKGRHIPMKVYNNGNLTSDINEVLDTWKTEFECLYSNANAGVDFDQEFFTNSVNAKLKREQEMDLENYEMNDYINEPISYHEVEYVIHNLKTKKATGFDGIPNEVLKHTDVQHILFNLFSKCFDYCILPSTWLKAIITPIPKSTDKDPFIPINYRGISLLSCVSKVFSSILNKRIVSYLELLEIYADEQNGYRKNRSCIDHVYTLTSIIRNRLANKQPTYCCFIDMKKAFDWIDRDLLFYKLLSYNIDGNMYKCIKALYSNPMSGVKLNNYFTDWFNTSSGVRQGDSLSPTLFGIFINDIAQEINQMDIGVQAGDVKLSILMYADDIVLMAENENNLQTMLDFINQWCKKWKLIVNEDKTKIMHFRNNRIQKSQFNFKYGGKNLEYVSHYKYLGFIIDEFMKFEENAETLAGAGGRALGAIISKFRTYKNIGFKTFTKMFDTCVSPILEYCSGVWGFKDFDKCDKVHHRAIRYFLGVHQKAPLIGICGDMGWNDAVSRRHLNMIKLWNRLLSLDDSRLTKKVFCWDQSLCHQNWSEDILKLFQTIDLEHIFHCKMLCDIESAVQELHKNLKISWTNKLPTKPKLRTYITFKDSYRTEEYVKYNISRKQRSLFAQFRVGILPLHIETGRFRGTALEERLCLICKNGDIENEQHFLIKCQLYEEHRKILYEKTSAKNSNFTDFDQDEKFIYLINTEWKLVCNYIEKAWYMRQDKLYSKEEE